MNYIDLWNCINYLLSKDEDITMPQQIDNVFRLASQQIIITKVWDKNSSIIDEMAEFAANYPKEDSFTDFMEAIIKYTESFILKMGRILNAS